MRLFSPKRIPFLQNHAELKAITVHLERRRSPNNRKSWWENSFGEKERPVRNYLQPNNQNNNSICSRRWALSGLHRQPVLQSLLLLTVCLSYQTTRTYLKARTGSFSVLLNLWQGNRTTQSPGPLRIRVLLLPALMFNIHGTQRPVKHRSLLCWQSMRYDIRKHHSCALLPNTAWPPMWYCFLTTVFYKWHLLSTDNFILTSYFAFPTHILPLIELTNQNYYLL